MGFEVELSILADTGKAAHRLADDLREVDCARGVPDGDAGMPGARAVAKLRDVKAVWQERHGRFVTDLDTHADNIDASVDVYRHNEDAAKREIDDIGGS